MRIYHAFPNAATRRGVLAPGITAEPLSGAVDLVRLRIAERCGLLDEVEITCTRDELAHMVAWALAIAGRTTRTHLPVPEDFWRSWRRDYRWTAAAARLLNSARAA